MNTLGSPCQPKGKERFLPLRHLWIFLIHNLCVADHHSSLLCNYFRI